MDKLLMLGTSYISCQMVEYAKSRGAYTIVADPHEPDKSIAKKLADEYWIIDLSDIDLLEKKCKETGVTGVICGISEFALKVCMELGKRLGYPCYCTPEAWRYSEDKDLFKRLCKRVGAPVATDYYVSSELTDKELDAVVFPVVVKPIDQNGNRGVSYCHNKEELRAAYKYALSVSKSDKIIVERMLVGEEWYGSYACCDGAVSLIALNAMYSEPGEPKNCYTVTSTVSNHVEDYINQINPAIERVLKEVGCTNGLAWVQVMLDEDGHFYILEMGYRLDGDMMFVTYNDVCGVDMVKNLVDLALGRVFTKKDLPMPQTKAYTKCGCGMELWTNKGGVLTEIRGLEEMRAIPGVFVESLHQIGDVIGVHRSCGNVCFTTENCDEMCNLIDKVNKTVSFINEKGEDMVIKYTNFDYLKKVYKEGLAGK